METYPVVIHRIRIVSMDMSIEGKEWSKAQLRIENAHQLHLDTAMTYIGWLAYHRAGLKSHSSVVVEFGHPEDANSSLDFGIIWEGELKTCEVYDGNLRLIQCRKCLKYGHIGTHCREPPTCGICAGPHEKDECPNPRAKKCALCSQAHTAWSESCNWRKEARKRLNEFPRNHR